MKAKKENIRNFETIKAYFHTSAFSKESYWKIWNCHQEAPLPGKFNTKGELEQYCNENFVGKYV